MAHQRSINKRPRPTASLSNYERDRRRIDSYFDVPLRLLQRLASSVRRRYVPKPPRSGKQLMNRVRHLTSLKNINSKKFTVGIRSTELTQEGLAGKSSYHGFLKKLHQGVLSQTG